MIAPADPALPEIPAPANVAGRNARGEIVPFRCSRCGADACYYSGRDWFCSADWINLQRG